MMKILIACSPRSESALTDSSTLCCLSSSCSACHETTHSAGRNVTQLAFNQCGIHWPELHCLCLLTVQSNYHFLQTDGLVRYAEHSGPPHQSAAAVSLKLVPGNSRGVSHHLAFTKERHTMKWLQQKPERPKPIMRWSSPEQNNSK